MSRLLLLAVAALAVTGPVGAQDELPHARELRRAFDRLEPDEQREVVEWYRYERTARPSFQGQLVRFVIDTVGGDRDPGTWPALEPREVYSAEEHTDGAARARELVDPDSSKARRARERLFANVPERRLQPGIVYDWGTGELRRLDDGREVERAFENALQGFYPDLDLAEALVERWLDDGDLRATFAAFDHAYCTRNGHAFGDLTLYDAWASGERFEVPDTDALGLIHDIEGDRRRWKAPLSTSKQRKLYEILEEDLFVPAHRYRGLRTAMARTYLIGNPALRDGYGPNLDRLQALWEHHESSVEALKDDLPTPQKWERYLESWVRRCKRDHDLREAGVVRRAELEADAAAGHALLVGILRESGAIE